jgi:integrase
VAKSRSTPSLRRHAPSKRAVVRLSGHDHYLGPWPDGSADPPTEAQAAYDRLIVDWLRNNRQPVPTPERKKQTQLALGDAAGAGGRLTVAELLVRFMSHAESYYRRTDGEPTSEVSEFTCSLRPVNHLFGGQAAEDFGPLKLKAVRDLMVRGYTHPDYGPQPALCRSLINKRVRRVVLVFKWGVSEELVPEATWQALRSVGGLKKGRSEARETAPVEPVAVEVVEKTLPHLNNHLQGAVRFQRHTGARPGEACGIRLAEVDRSRPVWIYRPAQHKTAHHGKARVVAIGPKGQEVLREFIKIRCPHCGVEGRPPRIGSRDGALCGPCADRMDEAGTCGPWERCEVQQPDAYLFSPADAMRERDEDRRARRKSKVQPSQVCRKKARAKKRPGPFFSRVSYAAAVYLACDRAGVPRWHANQLRHTHATEVRKRYGLEAAQVALGHATADVTQVYAERDLDLAVRVAAEIG